MHWVLQKLTGWKIDIKSVSEALENGLITLEELESKPAPVDASFEEQFAQEMLENNDEVSDEEVIVKNDDEADETIEVEEDYDDDDFYDLDDEYSKYDEEIDYDEYDKYYDAD